MALDIPSTQIYAGRYHHQKIKTPDLLQDAYGNDTEETKRFKDVMHMDTVTFSDEGLAKSKNWREYTKDNPNISHVNFEEQREEMHRQLNTVNTINTASMFNCELEEVAKQIKTEKSSCYEDNLTVMAKAYQVIYDRIEEDFADPDREPTWLLMDDGTYVEETKQDRIDALNKAYNQRAEFAAASAKVMAEIDIHFYGKHYSDEFLNEVQEKIKEAWKNSVSEKNLERLRQKVSSYKEYSLDFGISSQWSQVINSLLYRK